MIGIRKIAAIATVTVLLTNITTFALPQNSTYTKNISELEKEKSKIEIQVEKLDNSIENIMIEIDKNKKDLNKIKSDAKKIEETIINTEKDVQAMDSLFRQRARVMYINGINGYIEILAESKGIMDFISRLDMIKLVVNSDSKVINGLKDKKVALEESKKNLEEKSKKIIAITSQNEKQLTKMKKDKAKEMELVAKINRNQVSIRSQVAINTSAPVTKTLRASRGGMYSSSGTASNSNVLSYAYKFLGVPYLWGGTSPSGFDCSGFTQYVYSNFGVSLGRTTYTQINNGAAVPRSQLQPGDLVFFGSASSPHHVGIYVGNNSYIHAPRTGDVVKVSSLTRSDFAGGRRVK
ncbi:NlpC/P60 family protein [Haloimpatiens sp. FM7315]|uniref:C40 family peptidase n=1 Tax=Haloimpatiens sp. FM7315 TaxID=3298609 RepID=UPI003709E5ED